MKLTLILTHLLGKKATQCRKIPVSPTSDAPQSQLSRLACSPKSDPCVMRVSLARKGEETYDDKAEKKASHAGADCAEAS